MDFIWGNASSVINPLFRGAFIMGEHIHHLERDLVSVEETLERICRNKDDMDKHLQKERRCPTSAGLRWIEDVEKKKEEIDNIKRKKDKIMSNRLFAYFPGFWGQYRISRQVREHIEAIKELDQRYYKDRFVGRRIPLDLTNNYIPLESFEKKKSKIEELLTHKKVRKIAIWGSKGSGKTTLLKNIYSSNTLRNYFNYAIFWIDCSHLAADMAPIQKKILDTLDLPTDSNSEVFKDTIFSHLKETEFLLILDDFQDINDLGSLQAGAGLPLTENKYKIVFSCEKEELCTSIGKVTPFKMTGLSGEEGWKLFQELIGDVPTPKERDREDILNYEWLPQQIADRASQVKRGDNFLHFLLSKKHVNTLLYFLVLSVFLLFLLYWYELQMLHKRLGCVCALWAAAMISIGILWLDYCNHRDQNDWRESFDGESIAEAEKLLKEIFVEQVDDVKPPDQIGRSEEVAEPIDKKRRWKCCLSCAC